MPDLQFLIALLSKARDLLTKREISLHDYNIIRKSAGELSADSSKSFHTDQFRAMSYCINFIGRKLCETIEKKKIVTVFERIYMQEQSTTRAKNVRKLLETGNMNLLKEIIEDIETQKEGFCSYKELMWAIQDCLRNHKLLLGDEVFCSTATPALHKNVPKLRECLCRKLKRRDFVLLSQYINLCGIAVRAEKLTKMKLNEVSSTIANTLVPLHIEITDDNVDEKKSIASFVRVAEEAILKRLHLVRVMIEHSSDLFHIVDDNVVACRENIDATVSLKNSSSVSVATVGAVSSTPTMNVSPVAVGEASSSSVAVDDDKGNNSSSKATPTDCCAHLPEVSTLSRTSPSAPTTKEKECADDEIDEDGEEDALGDRKKSENLEMKAKSLSRQFPKDVSKLFDFSSMSLHDISSADALLDELSSDSDSCLSDDEGHHPCDSLSESYSGFLSKEPIGGSMFGKIEKRFFRLKLDKKRHVAYLSYFKDDAVDCEAKRHCVLTSNSVVQCFEDEKCKSKTFLKITFYDCRHVATKKGKDIDHDQLTLTLSVPPPATKEKAKAINKEERERCAYDYIMKWNREISNVLHALRKLDHPGAEEGSPKGTKSDVRQVLVEAGYAPDATRKADTNSTHQHGLAFGKTLVSKKKRRLVTSDGFDLDLAYITSNIIAMGFPSSSFEGWFVRNNMKDVRDYLTSRHETNYMLYNLCIEKGRSYDSKVFGGRVQVFPYFDHNPPPICYFWPFCRSVAFHLSKSKKHVVAIHCKAGKGRTGVMIATYLLYRFGFSADSAMKFYGKMRTHNGKGVTLPSQIRFIRYFEELCEVPFGYTDAMDEAFGSHLNRIRPVGSPPLLSDYLPRYLTRMTFNVVPKWMQESDKAVGEITTGYWEKRPRVFKIRSKMFEVSDDKSTVTVDFTCGGSSNGLRLTKETKFVIYKNKTWSTSKKKKFYFWIHDAFCSNTLVLTKGEIDGLHKDKKHKKVSKNFFIRLFFTPLVPQKIAASDASSPTVEKECKTAHGKSYYNRTYKDESETSFREGLAAAEGMYKSNNCTKQELATTLQMLDVARYCRMIATEGFEDEVASSTKVGGSDDD